MNNFKLNDNILIDLTELSELNQKYLSNSSILQKFNKDTISKVPRINIYDVPTIYALYGINLNQKEIIKLIKLHNQFKKHTESLEVISKLNIINNDLSKILKIEYINTTNNIINEVNIMNTYFNKIYSEINDIIKNNNYEDKKEFIKTITELDHKLTNDSNYFITDDRIFKNLTEERNKLKDYISNLKENYKKRLTESINYSDKYYGSNKSNSNNSYVYLLITIIFILIIGIIIIVTPSNKNELNQVKSVKKEEETFNIGTNKKRINDSQKDTEMLNIKSNSKPKLGVDIFGNLEVK